MHRKLLSASFVLLGTMMTACGGGAAFVVAGPPPPRFGVVGVAPGPGFVWTDGFWDLRGRDWVWVSGRWVRPPRRGALYVRPEWRHDGDHWRYHKGYWH